MIDLSHVPFWVVLILWPSLAAALLLAWLLRRARGSKLNLSGFGIKLEITDVPRDGDSANHTIPTN